MNSNQILGELNATLPKTLITLDLNLNQLSSLKPAIFDDLSKMQTLYAGANQLKSLNASVFARLLNLLTLDLSSNQLDELKPTIFDGLGKLQTLNMASNRLKTQCDSAQFIG